MGEARRERFRQAVGGGGTDFAEKRISSILTAQTREVLGSVTSANILSTNRNELSNRILKAARSEASCSFCGSRAPGAGRGIAGEAFDTYGYATVFRWTAAAGLVAVLFVCLEWVRVSREVVAAPAEAEE